MLRAISILLFLISLAHNSGYCQHVVVEGSVGYNFFDMETLKKIQSSTESSLKSSGIAAKSVESFPSYYNLQVGLWVKNHKALNFGVLYDYSSTGGRVDYRDYSGSITFDQTVSKHSIGIAYQVYIVANRLIDISLSMQTHLSFYHLVMSERVVLGNENRDIELRTKTSPTFSLQPGVSFDFNFDPVTVGLRLSYFIDTQNDFHLEGDDNANLTFGGSNVHSEWSAGRIELTVGLNVSQLLDI
jgi:hypothetical protein